MVALISIMQEENIIINSNLNGGLALHVLIMSQILVFRLW
nr:MAG TPA: hypothetical protein [Caudoviricetes sp.]